MKTEMTKLNEVQLKEEQAIRESEIKHIGDMLHEKWSKKKNLGEGLQELYDKSPQKARRTAIILENQEKHLRTLSEGQISSDFGTTPENVIRVVRLGYPNSVRGDIFHEFPMVTARDSIYYQYPTYVSTARGGVADSVLFESSAFRYASEMEEDDLGDGDGSTVTFTGGDSGKLSVRPLRPYTVTVYVDNKPVAVDNGANSLVGTTVDSGTINYTTGAFSITFTEAPADGAEVRVAFAIDTEVADSYTQIKAVKLILRDYQFRARPWPLYVSWSKMAELLIGTTLDIDLEDGLVVGAAEELKKSLDFGAVRLGYRYSKKNTAITFSGDFKTAGADSEIEHAQTFSRSFVQGEHVIYNQLQRGGISALVAGTNAVAYLTLHDKFNADGGMPKIGIYKVGTFQGRPVYQAPNDIVPANEMIGVWKNENESNDVAIAFGTLIPLYKTQQLEYKEAYKEQGLYYFGDEKVLQEKYLVRFVFSGITQA